MKIQLLYFAQLAENLGHQGEIREVRAGTTVGALWRQIQRTKAASVLKKLPLLKAVNEEYCDDDYVLQEGDRVAFLPPVAGG